MSENQKALQVAALENGTSIDHIPSSQLFRVAALLHLDEMDNPITIGNNFKSSKMESKGIIKISDRFFEEDEISRIAVLAPQAHINTIRGYEVVEKKQLILPDEVVGIVRCNNPRCISNNEPMKSRFSVIDKRRGKLQCRYCDTVINRDEIQLAAKQ